MLTSMHAHTITCGREGVMEGDAAGASWERGTPPGEGSHKEVEAVVM